MTETVTVIRDGDIARLRFHSGLPMNVITLELLGHFHQALDGLQAEPPRVLTITGADEVFSGGADLSDLRSMSDEAYKAFIQSEYRLFRRIDDLPFLTIAVISGPCIGNAAELALACDARLASSTMRFGLPETKVGFPAPAQRLARFVGIGRAKQMIYEGSIIKAAAALDMGLATWVVAQSEIADEAARLASRYAAFAPLATRHSKAALARAYHLADDHDAAELDAAFEAFKSADFLEGATAALERRPAIFT